VGLRDSERATPMKTHALMRSWDRMPRQAWGQKALKVVNRKPQMGYPFRILAFRLKCLSQVHINRTRKSLRPGLTAPFCQSVNHQSRWIPFSQQLLSLTVQPLIILPRSSCSKRISKRDSRKRRVLVLCSPSSQGTFRTILRKSSDQPL